MGSQDEPLNHADRQSRFRNVLVTGGAGFIGSNFLCTMVERHRKIKFVCYDALRSCASMKNLQPIRDRKNFEFVRGDVCDCERLLETMIRFRIDAVVHLAAESSVDKSINVPNVFAYSNVAGTIIVANCCQKAGVSVLLHASTDEVYGENDVDSLQAFDESSVLRPTNPYSFTKAVADVALRTWSEIAVIVVRPSNVYGPRQFPEKLISKLICQRLSGRKFTLHGNGLNSRCYMHIRDCVDALEFILFNGKVGKIYNIGTDDEFSNLEVARQIAEVLDGDYFQDSIEFVSDRKYNDRRYWMSSSLSRQLGWKPIVDFQAGLRETIEWYEKNMDGHWGCRIDDMIAAHPSAYQKI